MPPKRSRGPIKKGRSREPPPESSYAGLVPAIGLGWPPNSNNAGTALVPRPNTLPTKVNNPTASATGPGTPASLPLVGPYPGARPNQWTIRLQILSYLPVLRVPRLRSTGDGFKKGWEAGKSVPASAVEPAIGRLRETMRNDEAWMAQERGFVAVSAEDAEQAAENGERGRIPRCNQCTTGHPEERKNRPFKDCVYIYIADKQGFIFRACANCFYNQKSHQCSNRIEYDDEKSRTEQLADDAMHDYAQYLATLGAYNEERASRNIPPDPPQSPVDVQDHPGNEGPVPNENGRTGTGPADNPKTAKMYIARLIRLMDSGDGSIITPESRFNVYHTDYFNIDNPDFDVSYGDYLLYLERPERPGRTTLMRNYAGQQARVPTMMLQEIRVPWGLAGNILDPDGVPLDIRFFQNRVPIPSADSQVPGVISPLRDWDYEDMECVLFGDEGGEGAPMDLVVDVEGNCALLNQDLTDPWAYDTRNQTPGWDDRQPTNAEIGEPFRRPWNILVDKNAVEKIVEKLQRDQNIMW